MGTKHEAMTVGCSGGGGDHDWIRAGATGCLVCELRAENERLRAALVDCAHAGCPTAAESIAVIEGSRSEGDPRG